MAEIPWATQRASADARNQAYARHMARWAQRLRARPTGTAGKSLTALSSEYSGVCFRPTQHGRLHRVVDHQACELRYKHGRTRQRLTSTSADNPISDTFFIFDVQIQQSQMTLIQAPTPSDGLCLAYHAFPVLQHRFLAATSDLIKEERNN
jgi:hypothetical protein